MPILKLLAPAAFAIGVLLSSTASAQFPAATPPARTFSGSISNLKATEIALGRWKVEFDYVYNGTEPASVVVGQLAEGTGVPGPLLVARTLAQAGAHHFETEMRQPLHASVTTQVHAAIEVQTMPRVTTVGMASIDRRIRWPDAVQVDIEQAVADGKPERIVDKAALLIDTENAAQIRQARAMLQALVERSPRVAGAYLELARVVMKTNWSPAGLREAEELVRSSLQVRADNPDAQILLGYVLTHEHRFAEAEPLFVQAASRNPPNLWLWTNWGELLAMQGKSDAAILKLREAIRRPPTRNTYDRAREDAYQKLLHLAEAKGDVDAQEALHKQRVADYPDSGCFDVHYARFLVLERADGARAGNVLRDAKVAPCNQGEARRVQGLAHYVSWSKAEGAARTELLLRARAFLPTSPPLFQALASSDKTVDVAKQLIAAGERLDVQDNRNTDALGYALAEGQSAVARRLVKLGAKPDAPEGEERMPAALIPVLTGDVESIRMLRQAGVDYARLRFQGTTALDYARQRGDEKLLRALDPKASGL